MRRRPILTRHEARLQVAAVVVLALGTLAGCSRDLVVTADGSAVTSSGATSTVSVTAPRSPVPDTSSTSTSTTSSSTTSTSTTTSTTTATSTTSSSTTSTSTTTSTTTTSVTDDGGERSMPRLDAAASALVDGNIGVSVSVFVDGRRRYGAAWGARNDGLPIDTRSPFVIASVSKLFTSLAVARLVADGRIGLDDPVPWTAMGIAHDSTWSTVTVRELLTHGSGMPVARASWLDLPGPCTVPLVDAMATPPTATRGTWRYSNGNYCALGLLVEHLTGTDLAAATAALVFAPASVIGPTLSWAGERPDAAPYPKGVARLDRLGGAGAWLASTDAVAAVLSTVDATDRTSMPWPAVMVDQYGWGHTGTVDGAKACAWVIGEAVLVAVVAGDRPSTGGRICDRLVPAVAGDLGLGDLGPPVRSPA